MIRTNHARNMRAAPKTMNDIQAARGGFHAVDVYDGVVGRKLKCARCRRGLPEESFGRVGFKDYGRKVITLLHPHCFTCRKQAKGKWTEHSEYSPKLDRYWSKRLSLLRSGAYARNILVSVDKDDLLGKYLEQGGCCAITGLKMNPFGGDKKDKVGRSFAAPSVDRIDSDKHYTLDNIQIVLHAVNNMKGELPMEVFLEMCALIANKNLLSVA